MKLTEDEINNLTNYLQKAVKECIQSEIQKYKTDSNTKFEEAALGKKLKPKCEYCLTKPVARASGSGAYYYSIKGERLCENCAYEHETDRILNDIPFDF